LSRVPTVPTVAVIGGGMAGLACARTLSKCGVRVCVFDKGRGPGGRISTRRSDGYAFDHGAQYVTARDARFRSFVNTLRVQGLVMPWRGRFVAIANGATTSMTPAATERLVGVPGMGALVASLAADVRVVSAVQVTRIERCKRGWTLTAADGAPCGSFDFVIVAIPAPQARPLLEANAPRLADAAAAVRFEPCWAAMVALDRAMPVEFDAAVIAGGALSWIARNATKPQRREEETWVLHAADGWSEAHLEDDPAGVAEALLVAFADVTNVIVTGVGYLQAHLWRYARVSIPVGQPFLFDEERGIGACGDWCLGPRVEAAFLSGTAMAERLVATLPFAATPPVGP
jgi:renalase